MLSFFICSTLLIFRLFYESLNFYSNCIWPGEKKIRLFSNKPKENFNKPLTFFNEASRSFQKVLTFFLLKKGQNKGELPVFWQFPIFVLQRYKIFRRNANCFLHSLTNVPRALSSQFAVLHLHLHTYQEAIVRVEQF